MIEKNLPRFLKEMLYADKIMNTERYKELKDVSNKIAKKYLSHPNEFSSVWQVYL